MEKFEQEIRKILERDELEAFDALERAVTLVVSGKSGEVLASSVRTRKRWRRIQLEFRKLQPELGGAEAIRKLSQQYFYAEKTIEEIIYVR